MTHSQHLTTIAEFMGWEYENKKGLFIDLFSQDTPFINEYLRTDSFDTMRMVFDKWSSETVMVDNWPEMKKWISEIEYLLCYGTPSDCALRLAEAIEWWKSVK